MTVGAVGQDKQESYKRWIGASRPRMLRLIARYGDAFNTVWHTKPDVVAERFAATTAGISALVLGVGETSPENARSITGSQNEMIEALRGFAAVGVQHLVVTVPDTSEERIARFAPVIAALEDA